MTNLDRLDDFTFPDCYLIPPTGKRSYELVMIKNYLNTAMKSYEHRDNYSNGVVFKLQHEK